MWADKSGPKENHKLNNLYVSINVYEIIDIIMADINITANQFKEKYFQSQSWKNYRKYCTIAARKVVLAEYSAQ